MKTKHMAKWAVLALTAMLAWACSDPVSNTNTGGGAVGDTPPGSGSVGGTDAAKITFEGSTVNLTAGDVYSPKADLTTPDAGLTVSQDSSFFYAGSKSLKLTATVQQDKYDTTSGTLNVPPKVTEFGARIKVGTIANSGATLDLTDKIVTVRVFVPTGSPTTAIQVALQSNYQQAISPALSVTAGKWTSLTFKADSTKVNASGKLMFTSVTSTGAYDKNGAYSSATFDATAVDQMEIRAVGGAVGASGTLYIDSIDWADSATPSKAASPAFSVAAGSYSVDKSLSLTTTTEGAKVYYTMTSNGDDPADPTADSTEYTAAVALTVPATGVTTYKVKAVAIKAGITNSDIVSATYTLTKASYDVTFDLNYTGSTAVVQAVTDGGVATKPSVSRAGYALTKWTTDSAGTTEYDFTTVITGTKTVYAQWLQLTTTVVQDFEGTAPTLGVLNWNAASAVSTTSELAAYTATGNSDASNTKALLVANGGYNTVPTIKATLPAALSTYKAVKVQFFALGNDAFYKGVQLFAAADIADGATFGTTVGSNALIAKSAGNVITNRGAWSTATFDLTAAGNADGQTLIGALGAGSVELGIGASTARGGLYLIDNVVLVNADDTETVLENFEGTAPTVGVLNYNAKAGVIKVADIKSYTATGNAASTKAMQVLNGGYNTVATVTVTLPANLSAYSSLSVNVFGLAADAQYKDMLLFAAGSIADGAAYGATVGATNLVAKVGNNALAGLGSWQTVTFDLTAANTLGRPLITALDGTLTLELGIGASTAAGGTYLIDNITLVP